MKENCTKCASLVQCRTQIVYPTPCSSNGLLVIGEAPGRDEDIRGEGFAGIAGKTLDRLLAVHKIYRNDYARANICRCRPPENRKPKLEEIEACLPFLRDFIIEQQPKVILTIGATPTAIFCGKGALYTKIIASREIKNANAEYYAPLMHPEIKKTLPYLKYIVPSAHTSPLAFNRNSPSGEKWGSEVAKQVALAVELLRL